MAAPNYKEIPPLCMAGCGRFRQVYSINGGKATFLKTCARHTYKDIK